MLLYNFLIKTFHALFRIGDGSCLMISVARSLVKPCFTRIMNLQVLVGVHAGVSIHRVASKKLAFSLSLTFGCDKRHRVAS